MADLPGNISLVQSETVGTNKALSAQYMTQIGENINALILGRLFTNNQTFTSSGVFNVPEGATVGYIVAWGGGGGGGGNFSNGFDGNTTIWDSASNGQATFVGAVGGKSLADTVTKIFPNLASQSQSTGGYGGTTTDIAGVSGGISITGFNGGAGGGIYTGGGTDTSGGGGGGAGPGGNGGAGGGGASAPGNAISAAANTGAGGGGARSKSTGSLGSSGGNGAPRMIRLVELTPLEVVNVTIGAGGNPGGTDTGGTPGAGGSGQLTIFY